MGDPITEEIRVKRARKIASNTVNTIKGLLAGSLDSLITGLPILTVGEPAYNRIKYWRRMKGGDYVLPSEKPDNKNLIPYSIGASIPFAICYRNEIIDLVYRVYDKIF